MHSGPFGCLTKLSAKWAELGQKFVPQSRVGIFCHKSIRSTTLDPKLMFCCVLYYLVAFGTIWLPYEIRCKTGELVQKFVPRSRGRIFSNQSPPIHPIGLQNISLGSNGEDRVLFWCVSYHLGAFGTVGLPYETRCNTGQTSAKVRARKWHRNFLQRTHPIHPIGP